MTTSCMFASWTASSCASTHKRQQRIATLSVLRKPLFRKTCPRIVRKPQSARGGTFAKRANRRTTAGAGLQQHPHLLQLFELLRPLASTRVDLSIARYCRCCSMRTSAADKCSAVSLDSELSLLAVAHPVHETGDQDIKKNQQRNWHSS